ncbi:TonB C-terminal domain-containing protein [Undibacterium sp. Di27W]|uniref:TonB C-terminal domain-containing protein n=1 Tax=Undibacterium sp. Di27W TaxID=3413036 RepID=UPI003BF27EB9
MKSQNKKIKPGKQVKQEKLPDEQIQLAKAGDDAVVAVAATDSKAPVVSESTGKTAQITLKNQPAQLSAGKLSYEKLIFGVAITASLVLHATALLIHFVAPKTADNKLREPDLEVILVNAKHEKRPMKAEALAQADLDGGGAHDSGRSKSPLPDMKLSEDGDAVRVETRRITELEEQQKQLLDQKKHQEKLLVEEQDKRLKDDKPKPANGTDQTEASKRLSRTAAEIDQQIEDQNKRPRKTFITPTTQKAGYAQYYKQMQKRIEDMGTLNFPSKDGKKMYGELLVYIPVFQDGAIYEAEGGPRIERSSGNKALDAAALNIVRRAAPFGAFPKNMRSEDKTDVWAVITKFNFNRDLQLQTELRGGTN